MTDQTENQNAGIRWLSIFEMSMSSLVVIAVGGIFAIFMSVQSLQQSFTTMDEKFDQLVERFNRAEESNSARFDKIEGDVQGLQLDVAKIKERLGSSDD